MMVPLQTAAGPPLGFLGKDGEDARPSSGSRRVLGLDLGAETLRVVELWEEGGAWRTGRRWRVEHGKQPGPVLVRLLGECGWRALAGAAATGRLSRLVRLPRVPVRHALARGCHYLAGDAPVTAISIGSRGFSVLEMRSGGVEVFRENSRCSQGTGNFLRQLVERLSLDLDRADQLCADVTDPLPLSGRCPVILKTDMTHLANKGEDRGRILAGLFDAVCDNVLTLVKPGLSPRRVLLAGGVMASRRIREGLARRLQAEGFEVQPVAVEDAVFVEAIGCALLAAEVPAVVPDLAELLGEAAPAGMVSFDGLAAYAGRIRRLAPPRNGPLSPDAALILGLDIGSTGSKLVALDAARREACWEGYRRTLGNPVGAAQELLQQFMAREAPRGVVRAFGVTGSGRDVVGSMLTTCYGPESVFILNEIAAHAEGAVHFDPAVDTIFEIGGQDAKYIRLTDGQVVDCAMNEACSAGTGSFIEEQGARFQGVQEVSQLGREALEACRGVSLGQHCSVFMAEVIDEAIAAGVERPAILAGLHDSIIQNYLNRVKGSRPVGRVIFCQGMPFASDALAAAVVRQTGAEVIVPPNPGTVGALGIALLAATEVAWRTAPDLEVQRCLEARLENRSTFVCKSARGCGGTGNRCRIDTLTTLVDGVRQRFLWGGACALYDAGTRRVHLPDRSPDPFRERAAWLQRLQARLVPRGGRPRVALSDELILKELFPFFATFLHALGLDLWFAPEGDRECLRAGIRQASVPFCAPLQLFHGVAGRMAASGADWILLPMMRSLPPGPGEGDAVVCPMIQATPELLTWDLRLAPPGPDASRPGPKVLVPLFDAGSPGIQSAEFRASCRALAAQLGIRGTEWEPAWETAAQEQAAFEAACRQSGAEALAFCRERALLAVAVVGRPYTLHNPVLNSNVPGLLREQGALAIPVDCLPIEPGTPVFPDVYWGYAQRILRAASQVRRTPGLYAVYCSNYSCGPDSFNLHFHGYVMDGKPFAVVETDGHAGDAGTKTRLEAFLYCARRHWRRGLDAHGLRRDFARIRVGDASFSNLDRRRECLLLPLLGPAPAAFGACLRGLGLDVESLPPGGAEALHLGRRQTSGKECLPMCLTLGALLHRLQQEPDPRRRFVLGMPSCRGPCRFGVYNLLNRITLEHLGWADRVRIWSPQDSDYFEGLPPGFSALVYAAFVASDLLLSALHHVRPVEKVRGEAAAIYERHWNRLIGRLEQVAAGDLRTPALMWQVGPGPMFGLPALVSEAAREFREVLGAGRPPRVMLVGEIYVRCNEFANDRIIERLEERGLRVYLAPFLEWIEYADYVARVSGQDGTLAHAIQRRIQRRIARRLERAFPGEWEECRAGSIEETLAAGARYVPEALRGEAVLTVGAPLRAWREGTIDGVLNVGPHECMPSKIAESQFLHAAEREGLPSVTLPLNGDPVDPELLDRFVFEVCRRRAANRGGCA